MGACSDKSRDGDHHTGSTSTKTLSHKTEDDKTIHADFRSHHGLEGDHISEHMRPSQKDIKDSVCLFVKSKLKYHTHEFPHIRDLDSFRKHAREGAFEPWSHVHGLRSKVFWLHPETNTTGGFYTFFNRHALDKYMESELWHSMKKIPFLHDVEYEIHENLPGGELCADMGTWKHSKGKGRVV
jgi:hypothetical protein